MGKGEETHSSPILAAFVVDMVGCLSLSENLGIMQRLSLESVCRLMTSALTSAEYDTEGGVGLARISVRRAYDSFYSALPRRLRYYSFVNIIYYLRSK